jgi:hypothetical protein
LREEREDAAGRHAQPAVGRETRVPVPLRQPPAVGADDEREVVVGRDAFGEAEGIVQQHLPRRGVEQVVAATTSVTFISASSTTTASW